jgi:hypothetical protein
MEWAWRMYGGFHLFFVAFEMLRDGFHDPLLQLCSLLFVSHCWCQKGGNGRE